VVPLCPTHKCLRRPRWLRGNLSGEITDIDSVIPDNGFQMNLWYKADLSRTARKVAVVLLSIFFLGAIHSSREETSDHDRFRSERGRWVDQTLNRLSLEEKVGQMLQIRVYGDYPDFNNLAYRFVVDEIQKYHIGSVDLAARMSGPNLVKGNPLQVAAITNQLQQDSNLPLLVGADIERGLASRLSGVPEFPFPMAFGAIEDPQIVERFGEISAREARAVGIQWAFAPDADVNSNPANPIINVRSYGEDPQKVGELVVAYIRGAHKSGLFVAVKHFPGHGDSSTDSHVGIVHIGGDRQHLEKYELPPFKEAIAAGADSVLLAHAAVPALDPDEHRISTTSPIVVDSLLRHQLGFRGVVLTDALEMRGLMSLYPQDSNPSGRAAIEAIKAGVDVLMLPKDLDATFSAILAAVRNKEISENRIDESVRRILEMKAAARLDESRFVDLKAVQRIFPDADANTFAQHVADEAVTLVRSNGQVLPLSPTTNDKNLSNASPSQGAKRLLVVSFVDSVKSRLGHEFDLQLQSRRPDAKIFHYYNDHIGSDAVPSEVLAQLGGMEKIVIVAFVTHVPGRQVISHGRPITAVGLSGDSAEFLEDIVSAAPGKTVVVAVGSPYLIQNYPKIENYICTYSLVSTSEISAVRALFGELQNHAKLPVTLPGVAERGFSEPWPQRRGN
jgi:beta-N-acetylhexosaminidase